MNATIDSSIFVEAVSKKAVNQQLFFDLIKLIYTTKNISVYQPAVFLFEFVSAAIRQEKGNLAEKTKRLDNVLRICNAFIRRDGTYFIDITVIDWRKWCSKKNALELHKSQDEIFMLTAMSNNAILFTLDQEMIYKPDCFMGKCEVCSPYEGLKLINKLKE